LWCFHGPPCFGCRLWWVLSRALPPVSWCHLGISLPHWSLSHRSAGPRSCVPLDRTVAKGWRRCAPLARTAPPRDPPRRGAMDLVVAALDSTVPRAPQARPCCRVPAAIQRTRCTVLLGQGPPPKPCLARSRRGAQTGPGQGSLPVHPDATVSGDVRCCVLRVGSAVLSV
jgi:hypothetical protein